MLSVLPRPLNILIVGDSPLNNSAYSLMGHDLAKYLSERGHNVKYYALHYSDAPISLNGFEVWGNAAWSGGVSLLEHYLQKSNCDFFVTLKDPIYFPNELLRRACLGASGKPWVALAPVDTEPPTAILCKQLEYAALVLTLTEFSMYQLQQQGVQALFAPCWFDKDKFFVDADVKAAWRKMHNIPETAFVVGTLAANRDNPSRKNLPLLWIAMSHFIQRYPEGVYYALHTDLTGSGGHGVNMYDFMQLYPISARRLVVTDPAEYLEGVPQKAIRDFYNGLDLFLLPSAGEGFCIPVLEAAACGVPAIVSNFTSSRGVKDLDTDEARAGVFFGGWMIPTEAGALLPLGVGGYRFIPHLQAILDALQLAYTKFKDDPLEYALLKQAVTLSAQRFEAHDVLGHWGSVLERFGYDLLTGDLKHAK